MIVNDRVAEGFRREVVFGVARVSFKLETVVMASISLSKLFSLRLTSVYLFYWRKTGQLGGFRYEKKYAL